METLSVDDLVFVEYKNGQLLCGRWKGTSIFNNKPIISVGNRGSYVEEVKTISRIDVATEVYNVDKTP